MDDKEQNEFIQFLRDQLQASDDSDFEQKVQQLGEEGIKQAHIAFQKAKVKQYMTGGKLERVKQLVAVKQKGGLIKGGTKAVKEYQAMLNKFGYKLKEDGGWGAKTQAAYEDYIKKNAVTGNDQVARISSSQDVNSQANFSPITGSANTAQLRALPGILQNSFTPAMNENTSRIPDVSIANAEAAKLNGYYNPIDAKNIQASFNFATGKLEMKPKEKTKSKTKKPMSEVYPVLFTPRAEALQGIPQGKSAQSPWTWSQGNNIDYGPEDFDYRTGQKVKR